MDIKEFTYGGKKRTVMVLKEDESHIIGWDVSKRLEENAVLGNVSVFKSWADKTGSAIEEHIKEIEGIENEWERKERDREFYNGLEDFSQCFRKFLKSKIEGDVSEYSI